MGVYFKNHLWELLSCIILSAALSLNVFAGYEITDPKASGWLTTGLVCAVSMMLLFAAGYNRRTTVAGIAVTLVLLVAAVIAIRSFHMSDGRRIDDNPVLFWLVTIGTSVVCYLLSRWRISLIILLTGGSIMLAAFGFLRYPVSLPAFFVFLFSVILLYLHRVYHGALLSSYTGNVRFTAYTAQSAVFVLVVVLLSGAVFAGIIRPLDPPEHPLKLITRLQSLEILQQVGVSRRTEVKDPDQSTEIQNDQTEMSSQKKNRDENRSPQEKKDQEEQGTIRQQTEKEKAQAVSYHRDRTWLYISAAFLILLLVAAPFLLRYLLIRNWERRVRAAGPTDGAAMVYLYLQKKLRYAGFTRPPEITLYAYMKSQRRAMKHFAEGATDLFTLTGMYQQIVYGCRELDEKEFRRFWNVYTHFRKNMKEKMGRFRYALYFFFI